MVPHIFNWIRKQTLKLQIFLAIMFIAILLVVVFSVVFNSSITSLVENYLLDASRRLLEYSNMELKNKLESVYESSNQILVDSDIQRILKTDSETYSFTSQIQDYNTLEKKISDILTPSHFITNVYLLVNPDFYYAREKKNIYGLHDEYFYPLSKSVSQEEGGIVWGMPFDRVRWNQETADRVILCGRELVDMEDFTLFIGELYFEISLSAIQDVLELASYHSNDILLLNADNQIIAGYSNDGKSFSSLDFNCIKPSSNKFYRDAENNVYLSKEVPKTNWKMVSVLRNDDISKTVSGLRNKTILIFILAVLIAMLLAMFISRLLLRRINSTNENMEKSFNQGFSSIPIQNDDEIAFIERQYNSLVLQIKKLMDDKYKLGEQVQKNRYDALRSQLNPHFLYNAFNTIGLLSMKNNVPEITEMIKNLALYYRISLNNGNDWITVRKEITHIQAYLDILKIRFDLPIVIDNTIVDESILNILILNLIFQPVVENAILHGIHGKKKDFGLIRISGEREGQYLILRIEDNGEGCDIDSLEKAIETQTEREKGYGLYNVNKRIQLIYGSDCGISFMRSSLGGLMVSFCLKDLGEIKK